MRRSSYGYLVVVLTMVAVYGLSAAGQSYAAESAQSENKVVKFFKGLFNWPFGVTKKSAETVGRTTKRATTAVTTTGSRAVETVTGRPEKLKDVMVEPVKGSAETAYTAVEGSLKAPIEGTKESFE